MQRCAAPAVLVALAACAATPRLPAPPPYSPVNSPEAKTPCEADWRAAKEARENLLDADTAAHRRAAAQRVFLQAECERRFLAAHPVGAATQEAVAEQLRAARGQYQNAKNLYEEVDRYQVLRFTIGGRAGLGALHLAFADKLRGTTAPQDLRDPQEQAAFAAELGRLARTFDREAVLAFRSAVRLARSAPHLAQGDGQLAAWVESACQRLAFLSGSGDKEALCSNGPR